MRARVKKIRVVPENVFCPIAVVHIEIDHGDSLEKPYFTGMKRTDGDIVEKTKSHRAIGRRVMSRRTYRAEGVLHLPIRDAIDRAHNGARCAQRGFARTGRHRCIGIDERKSVLPRFLVERPKNGIDMRGVMRRQKRGHIRSGRLFPRQAGEIGPIQSREHRTQPIRTLGVARRRDMTEAGSVRN